MRAGSSIQFNLCTSRLFPTPDKTAALESRSQDHQLRGQAFATVGSQGYASLQQ